MYSINQSLNILNSTTNLSNQACINSLAGTSGLLQKDAFNVWAGTTGLSRQDAANVKAGTSGLSLQKALETIAYGLVPSFVSGLAFDWDFSRNVYSDGGTTLVTDGGTIQQINDQSGNARNGTQSTSGSRPTYRATGGPNSLPCAEFDGTSDFLSFPTDTFTAFTAGEIFIVIKIDSDPPGASAQTGIWSFSTNGDGDDHYPWNLDSKIYMGWGSTTRKDTGDPTPSLASWRLYNVSSASGAYTTRIDGTQHFTTGTNTVSFASSAKIGNSNSGQYYLDGRVARVIMYNKVLSTIERSYIHRGIASVYGLTIS